MADNYANAADVLPPELLAQVQQYHTGHLWVPDDGAFYRERNERIVRLYAEGVPTRDISATVHLSERRVGQILEAVRADAESLANSPENRQDTQTDRCLDAAIR